MTSITEASSVAEVKNWLEKEFDDEVFKKLKEELSKYDGKTLLSLSYDYLEEHFRFAGIIAYSLLHTREKPKKRIIFNSDYEAEDFNLEQRVKEIWKDRIQAHLDFLDSLPDDKKGLPYGLDHKLDPLFSDYLHDSIIKKFKWELSSSVNNDFQDRRLISLYQCSGSGKTKLCFELARRYPVVIIRDIFTKHIHKIETLVLKAYEIAQKNNALFEYFSFSISVVTLYVLSNIEFYLSFIEYGRTMTDRNVYDLALKYCQNEDGFHDIYQLFCHNLIKIQTKTISYDDMKRNIMKLAKEQGLVVCFDEVIMSKNVLNGYFSTCLGIYEIKERETVIQEGKSTEDLLWAFTATAERFILGRVPIVFISTHRSAFEAIDFARGGSRYIMFQDYLNLPTITSVDIVNYCKEKFNVSLDKDQMDYFSGRPLYFSHLQNTFYDYISRGEVLDQTNVDAIIDRAKKLIKMDVNEYISKMEESGVGYDRALFNLQICSGVFDFEELKYEEKNEVDFGIARLERVNFRTVAKIDEIPILEALYSILQTDSPPNSDPIFNYISSNLSHLSYRNLDIKYITARLLMKKNIDLLKRWNKHTPGTCNEYFDTIHFAPMSSEINFSFKETQFEFSDCLKAKTLIFPDFGPDIIGSLYRDNGERIPLVVIIKRYDYPLGPNELNDCLTYLHPYSFFHQSYKERRKFLEWWRQNNEFFKYYVRIIVSFSGFTDESLQMVHDMNESNKNQCVLVAKIDESDIGNKLTIKLEQKSQSYGEKVYQYDEDKSTKIENFDYYEKTFDKPR